MLSARIRPNLWWKELALFGSAQILGVAAARYYWHRLLYFSETGQEAAMPRLSFDFSFFDAIVVAAVLLVFIWASFKPGRASRFFFRVFFWLVIFGGSQMVFYAFFSPLAALIAALAVLLAAIKIRTVLTQNLAVLLAVAGIGLALGLSLTPLAAVAILVCLSFYDIFAVYVSKHMVKMAEGMMTAKAIFGFIIPAQASDFKEKIDRVQTGDQFMVLGSGDIALPLVLAVSLIKDSLWQSGLVVIFALFGLFLTHLLFFNQKERRPMAALPPIAMMSVIGYLVGLILV